ncbi:helix-turn-helix transcriptional regulator [Pasteurella atlantica]|uniref:Helix-turn-helix transcriptional regulator n=2 Tax=Phocoenobacter skyensis TaxID=97481 RepID=A0ABT9JJ87_9PAST|nr:MULTISPECIES: helix-turn-helix transcriptional regulator [Pasteurella]MDP8033613.1 helix-turn-helix transcriptional regulator [Pasteurella atlantica]MDP8035607.1 helix-turn-helix transcriptional regulator [Pasteurella atlantica]MDP8037558.1 helix-turn-helix transcriptional regulator [Pasteurella atlantica]MDP8047907.1 helix-turn-helix transcriptional regulator [Pasteurella atlantica]MDP8049862.1 helix-turn-helix transcriptional regulator [Pasteurella atlantica]
MKKNYKKTILNNTKKNIKESYMKHIGENIKHIRKSAGISQQDLADMSGISKGQISKLESGEQNNPQINTVVSIAANLGVAIEEIIYGEKTESFSYLEKALKELPEEDQYAIKQLIKTWLIMRKSEKIEF